MVTKRSSSRRSLLRGLLVALICVSAFYVTDGIGRTSKRRNRNRAALDIRKYCRAIGWFDKRQRNICVRSPKLIEVVQKGIENALEECRRQFKSYRWNCSPLTWNEVFSEGGILKKRSRETAFIQALTSASVMVEIAKSCASGNYKHCKCGDHPRPKALRRRAPIKFVWDGCPDNFNFGAHFTKRFMDPRKITNHAKKTKSHNQEVGRKIVRKLKVRSCKCHGKSDACTYMTCWYTAPNIEKVGDQIWKLYHNSIRSQWNKTENRLYDRYTREKSQDSSKLNGKLVYFSKSENFCVQNLSMGVMGTFGRQCNSTSNGPEGCNTMCCGRAHKREEVPGTKSCNCKFVWCCNVECQTCNTTRVVESCL